MTEAGGGGVSGGGGGGGVDDVGRVGGCQRAGAVGVGQAGAGVAGYRGGGGGVVEVQPGRGGGGQADGGGGDDQGGLGVGQHERDPVLRVGGVDGEVGGAGLEDGEDGGDHLRGPGQGQRDELLGAGTGRGEVAGELAGAGVELGVGELCRAGDQRGRAGCAGRLGLEQLGDRAGRDLAGRAGPGGQDLGPFGRGGQLDAAYQLAGISRDRGQEHLEVPGHPFGGGGVEQVGAVGQCRGEPAVVLAEVRYQVEIGGGEGLGDGLDGEAGECGGSSGGVLQDDHGLEEGGAAGVAVGLEGVDDAFEGDVLVGEGVQGGVADLGEEGGEGVPGADGGAQDDGVDEEPDDVLEFGAVAAGDGGADGDVVLTGPAGEQDLGGGGQDHEQGGVVGAGEVLEPGGDLGGDGELAGGPVRGADRGAGLVGGQFQGGQPGQLPGPVVQSGGQHGVGELGALPDGVVGVLDGQRFQCRFPAVERGGVQDAEFLGQDSHGPAVGDDVVHGQGEHVVLGGGADQPDADERALAQVERRGAVPGHELGDLGFAPGCRQPGQVEQRDPHVIGRVDELDAAPVAGLQGGAQGLMAGYQRGQGCLESAGVEGAGQAGCCRGDVLGAAWFELVQEPQALLGEGQGQRAVMRDGGDGQHRRVRRVLVW